MKCSVFNKTKGLTKFVASFSKVTHDFRVLDWSIWVRTNDQTFLYSDVYLECKDCKKMVLKERSPLTKKILENLKKNDKPFPEVTVC